jgi:hypothetical protein
MGSAGTVLVGGRMFPPAAPAPAHLALLQPREQEATASALCGRGSGAPRKRAVDLAAF